MELVKNLTEDNKYLLFVKGQVSVLYYTKILWRHNRYLGVVHPMVI